MRAPGNPILILLSFGIVILPLAGQTLTSALRPTQPQVDLLDQIQGVGSFKFGAKIEDFDKASLKPAGLSVGQPPNPSLCFQDVKSKGFSWGTLSPSNVELQFYYGQLITIRLLFNQETGDLLAVNKAFVEKYGNSQQPPASIRFADGTVYSGRQWGTSKIQVRIAFPESIPMGVYADFLKQKAVGAVELFDFELCDKLSHEKLDAAQQDMLKSHDLDKIKSDL